MSTVRVSAKLDRTDGSTPWGFRMAGGKDFGSPLIIQRVNPGSLSARCGLQVGDTISSIGGHDSSSLSHKEAQDLILGAGNSLELKLERDVQASYGNDYHNQQLHQPAQSPEQLPWQHQQVAKPAGLPAMTFAPKPYQKQGAVTSITTHTANLSLGGSSSSHQEVHDSLTREGGIRSDIPDIPNEDLTNRTIGRSDDQSSSFVPLSSNSSNDNSSFETGATAGSAEPRVIEEKTASGGGDGVYPREDSDADRAASPAVGSSRVQRKLSWASSSVQSADGEEASIVGKIFPRRNSQTQSKSFRRLQDFLEESEKQDNEVSSSPSLLLNVQPQPSGKPQILSKPKIAVPAKPVVVSKNSFLNKESGLTAGAASSALSKPAVSASAAPQASGFAPGSSKPFSPSSSSRPVGAAPPARPVPPVKQYNNPVGLYSKEIVPEAGQAADAGEVQSAAPAPSQAVQLKEVAAGAESIIASSSQRKTITIPSRGGVQRHGQPPTAIAITVAVAVPDAGETVVQSAERKQIIVVKPKSTAPYDERDLLTDRGAAYRKEEVPVERGIKAVPHDECNDVIYGSEKPKIVIKTKNFGLNNNNNNNNKNNGDNMISTDFGGAINVCFSVGEGIKECLPSTVEEVRQTRPQIKVVPRQEKPAGQPPSHGSPVSAPAPRIAQQAGGVWRPQVPTGERKMKVGRPGMAQRKAAIVEASRVPICTSCHTSIRGPFISALDKTWCPDHFVCANPNCAQPLINCGFVEEMDQLYCEHDYEKYLAPRCARCSAAIVGEVVNAMKNTYHMDCFVCVACHQPIGTGSFHNEDGKIYCAKDWGALFQTKCYGCQFPIEPGDRWVEALSQNWHSECFNCSTCQISLEGQSFCAKNGKPYCKKHGGSRRI